MRMLLGVAAALLFTTGAGAAPEAKSPPAAPTDKPICKRIYEADTGSHFRSSKRVCHTAAEWKEIEDGTERVMKTIRENSGINPGDLAPGIGGGPQ
ncbi:MAG TPA: hypothetical protein VFK28_02620 [Sphingomicrobium sp.]|nr:hypothetical protein [Sphingomicrobium sp.]